VNAFFEISNVVLRNCIASASSRGFVAFNNLAHPYQGPILENCIARNNSTAGFWSQAVLNAIFRNCISEFNIGAGFVLINNTSSICEGCISNSNSGSGFHVQTVVVGLDNANIVCDYCLATNNGVDGFTIDATSTGTLISNSVASKNAGSGINNLSASTFMVDNRSQQAATAVNVAYNLNTNPDVISGGTVIIIS